MRTRILFLGRGVLGDAKNMLVPRWGECLGMRKPVLFIGWGAGVPGDMLGDRLEQWGLLVLASRFRVCRKGISGMSPHGEI